MKKQIRPYFIVLLILVAVLETLFIGCGGGSSNSFDGGSSSSEETAILSSPSVYASKKGTFYLKSIHSSFVAQASEENTIKDNSSITLIERARKLMKASFLVLIALEFIV